MYMPHGGGGRGFGGPGHGGPPRERRDLGGPPKSHFDHGPHRHHRHRGGCCLTLALQCLGGIASVVLILILIF